MARFSHDVNAVPVILVSYTLSNGRQLLWRDATLSSVKRDRDSCGNIIGLFYASACLVGKSQCIEQSACYALADCLVVILVQSSGFQVLTHV